MIRTLAVVCLAAALAACASTDRTPKAFSQNAPTPLDQYKLSVTRAPDEIMLAPHATGLSPNQASALASLVSRWRDADGAVLLIRAPNAGGAEAYRMAEAIRGHLEALGVQPPAIQLASYNTQSGTGAPIVVGFDRYKADIPKCNQGWDNLTHTIDNEVDKNFGCSVTANIGAMVANPEDLVHPAAMGDADAGRREVTLDKYRQGQISASAKDPQADAAISTAIR